MVTFFVVWCLQFPSNQRDSGTCDHQEREVDEGGAVVIDAATNTVVTGDVSSKLHPLLATSSFPSPLSQVSQLSETYFRKDTSFYFYAF